MIQSKTIWRTYIFSSHEIRIVEFPNDTKKSKQSKQHVSSKLLMENVESCRRDEKNNDPDIWDDNVVKFWENNLTTS